MLLQQAASVVDWQQVNAGTRGQRTRPSEGPLGPRNHGNGLGDNLRGRKKSKRRTQVPKRAAIFNKSSFWPYDTKLRRSMGTGSRWCATVDEATEVSCAISVKKPVATCHGMSGGERARVRARTRASVRVYEREREREQERERARERKVVETAKRGIIILVVSQGRWEDPLRPLLAPQTLI
jgi:hypothetical protein